MTKLEYYPLEEAAEITGYSKEQLIRIGATGTLPIYVLTGKFYVSAKAYNFNGKLIEFSGCHETKRYMRLTKSCLLEMEDSKSNPDIELAEDPYFIDCSDFIGPIEFHNLHLYNKWVDRLAGKYQYILIPKGSGAIDYRPFGQDLLEGKITREQYERAAKNFPPSIKVNDCTMIILAADLKRLQEPEQETEGPLNDCSTAIVPRSGGYYERDVIAIKLAKDRPELLSMRKGAIKKALEEVKEFPMQGFDDWWRRNPVFQKGIPGRNKNS